MVIVLAACSVGHTTKFKMDLQKFRLNQLLTSKRVLLTALSLRVFCMSGANLALR